MFLLGMEATRGTSVAVERVLLCSERGALMDTRIEIQQQVDWCTWGCSEGVSARREVKVCGECEWCVDVMN